MSFEVQDRIKKNAMDIREYSQGLHQWIEGKEQKMNMKSQAQQVPPPVQPKKEESKVQQPKPQANQEFIALKRDINTVSDYYKAWDRFNVDSELKVLDSSPTPVYNPYQNSKSNIRAKPKVEMTVKGGRARTADPTSLKDRGNMHFKSCEFDKAIQCYTQCLVKIQEVTTMKESEISELKVIIYSNRAMARLKRNLLQEAVDDCTESLRIDDRFIKSYLRRGEAYQRLKKFKLAKFDYERIKEIDPQNATIIPELKRVNKILENNIEQAHKKLVVSGRCPSVPTERIEIVEIDEVQNPNRPQNYLQQL